MARLATSPPAIAFRQQMLPTLTRSIGVYALCDLDGVPIYVGQSIDGIRQRVQRHLTSARSDVIANRQIDIWEVAFVRAWPVDCVDEVVPLEASLFHVFNDQSPLMNGSIPVRPETTAGYIEPFQIVQMIADDELARRRQPEVRLPRQIDQYLRLVDHFLNVKDSVELQVAMEVHFERLSRYHRNFLEKRRAAPRGSQDVLDDQAD